MTTSAHLTSLVDRHLDAYCEPDATRRAALLAEVWAPDGRLVDPPAVGEGHEGISKLADALLEQFPGHRFERTSVVDAHNDVLRYDWRLISPQGDPVLAGVDFAAIAADGRLQSVTGFFGPLAPVDSGV